ncbi:MAG: NADH-quinone oxidoreductase subunit M [Candidatus Omnitrophica bacterium]|nr:NADH-quinone oxidoreductase subunit M [Candidatus Omnitrophota bacterium]
MSQCPYFLTILTLTPLVGGIVIACLKQDKEKWARGIGLGFSLLSLASVLWLWFTHNPAGGLQRIERHVWIPSIGVEYFLGIDGLGLLMVLLTAAVVPFALFAPGPREGYPKSHYSLFLFLEAGLFGTFTALNFFHWFIFWELSLIPAFFLIKLWGGPRRSYAATQFFIYTLVGSVAMLLAFQAIFLATGTFDFVELARLGRSGQLAAALANRLGWQQGSAAMLIFLGVFLGLAVKVPLVPFHTWLPAAYAEAPTGTSMVLTGVMSKMGVYGFLRILMPLFPEQMRMVLTPLLWLTVITIVYAAWAAMAQTDLKRTIAYSSINHLGYCMLGIFAAMKFTIGEAQWTTEKAAALNGVLLQMFNHGLSASALFCFIGLLERRAGGMRGLNDFGGLRKVTPVFCGLMGIAIFSSLGLPGLNGFVGEFLIFKGSFSLASWAAAGSVLGLLLTAIFLLIILQRVFHGPLNQKWTGLADLSAGERWMVSPVIALMFLIGIYPQLIIKMTNPTVLQMVSHLTH